MGSYYFSSCFFSSFSSSLLPLTRHSRTRRSGYGFVCLFSGFCFLLFFFPSSSRLSPLDLFILLLLPYPSYSSSFLFFVVEMKLLLLLNQPTSFVVRFVFE
ncbi:hypothetical protein BKA81DRAFT_359831 [Phyllosticta paracitricarpa]|uniref:Transmembrane protein n=1 Tax=Phyllosticta citricarpa TaxID=55181 RepID=A0ABR1M693_9PEZI